MIAVCDRQFGVGGDGVLAILPPHGRRDRAHARAQRRRQRGRDVRQRHPLRRQGAATSAAASRERAHGDRDRRRPARVRARRRRRGGARRDRRDGRAAPAPRRDPDDGAARRALPRRSRSTARRSRSPRSRWATRTRSTFVDSRDDACARSPTTLGPTLERHAWFPQRTNAEFASRVRRREIDLVVWERGCGITLACGTGACATAVAAIVDRPLRRAARSRCTCRAARSRSACCRRQRLHARPRGARRSTASSTSAALGSRRPTSVVRSSAGLRRLLRRRG